MADCCPPKPMEPVELSSRVSEALRVIEDVTEMSGKFLINKNQCERLAARVGAHGEKLKNLEMSHFEPDGSKSAKVNYPAFDLLLTVLRKAKALLSKYIDVQGSIPTVLTHTENRKAFEEIHEDLDSMNSQFCFEDFESAVSYLSERKAILEDDANKDLKEMPERLEGLKHISEKPRQTAEADPLFKNLPNVKMVVSEKTEGTSSSDHDLPSYLTIDPAVVEIKEPVRIPDRKSNHDPAEMDGWALVRSGNWLGCRCALKVFKSGDRVWDNSELLKEASSLMKLHHPHVVQLMGFAQDAEKCLILMELMDTDLRHFMKPRLGGGKRPFSRAEEMDIITQIAKGMYYLHEQEYVHGELKCSNILVKQICDHIDVKISDLRSSQKLGVWNPALFKERSKRSRPRWTAPEVKNYHGELIEPTDELLKKTDVYSFGMVCYEVVTGKLPFQDIFDDALKTRIETGELRQELPEELDDKLRGLIESCWERDPNRRPTFAGICHQLEYIRSSQLPLETKSFGKDRVLGGLRWTLSIVGVRGGRAEKPNDPSLQVLEGVRPTWGKTNVGDRELAVESESGVTLPEFVRIDPADLKKGRLIGSGAFADVYEATWLGCKFAVKTLKRFLAVELLQREVKFLIELRHPSIVRLMGLAVHSERRCSIVMEFMGCSLRKLIDERKKKRKAEGRPEAVRLGPFSLREAVYIITKIAEGMAFLHFRGVMHRDLKADNVLVPDHPGFIDVKIADFGVSELIDSGKQPTTGAGTRYWRAPEVLPPPSVGTGEAVGSGQRRVDIDLKAADVYSFAMTCYEVLTGEIPLDAHDRGEKGRQDVVAGLRPTLPSDLNSDLKLLIEECWDGDPKKRPSFSSICQRLQTIQVT